jgi:hypothetical protein
VLSFVEGLVTPYAMRILWMIWKTAAGIKQIIAKVSNKVASCVFNF